MLEKLIRKYLESSAQVDPNLLDNPAVKMKELGLDSLGLVEMLFEIEDRFGFQVDEPMRFGEMSFGEMVADLEATIRSKNNGELPALPDE